MKPLLSALLVLACSPLVTAQRTVRNPTKSIGNILVSGFNSDAVHAYTLWNGKPIGSTPAPGAQSIVLGPDGLLYVCAEKDQKVLRLDPDTLTLVDEFVADDPLTLADENGPLLGPTAAVFGPGGNLFVASFDNDRILRYDGTTGAYIDTFVAAGLGGLNGPDAGTKFGPDGMLYVPSFFGDSVLRYDASGAFVDDFVAFREGNLRQPRDIVFHKGSWYVASSFNNRILQFDEAGVFVKRFANVSTPYALAFHPYDGHLYVAGQSNNNVSVLSEIDGSFLRLAVPAGAGGLDGSTYVSFVF